MVPGKLATLGLLEIKVFWNKDYDSTISVHDATHKILWCDSNYIVDMVMWPKSGNWKISMREVMTTSIYKDFTKRNHLRDAFGSSSIIWDWH